MLYPDYRKRADTTENTCCQHKALPSSYCSLGTHSGVSCCSSHFQLPTCRMKSRLQSHGLEHVRISYLMYRICKPVSLSCYWRNKKSRRVFPANSNSLLIFFSSNCKFSQLRDCISLQLSLPPSLSSLLSLHLWYQTGIVHTVSFHRSRKHTLQVMITWHDSNTIFKIQLFNRKFRFNFTKYRYTTTQYSKIMELKNNFKIFNTLGSKINNAI